MNFPVLLKTGPEIRSDESIYYLVAANGVFQVRTTSCYRAVTRAEGAIPGLCPQAEYALLDLPALPRSLIREVLAFFYAVYSRHGGEAIVILFYRPEARSFRALAPPQNIPGYRGWDGRWRAQLQLSYGQLERPAGYLRFGTIHSHAHLPACASDTDCDDERHEDGLHLVYGDLHRREPSRSACFVANGARFALDCDKIMPSCPVPQSEPDPKWMARVQRERAKQPESWFSFHA